MAIITARFTSACNACSVPVQPGDRIDYRGKGQTWHERCVLATPGADHVSPAAAPTTSPATSGRRIDVTREGRRSYISGDTLAVRSILRDGGCHWDADSKRWWIGSHEAAQAIAETCRTTATVDAAPKKRVTCCVQCGAHLDDYTQRRGYVFCSKDCAIEKKMGSGWSGRLADGSWHQGSDD